MGRFLAFRDRLAPGLSPSLFKRLSGMKLKCQEAIFSYSHEVFLRTGPVNSCASGVMMWGVVLDRVLHVECDREGNEGLTE